MTREEGKGIASLGGLKGRRRAAHFLEESCFVVLVLDLVAHKDDAAFELPTWVVGREFTVLLDANLEDTPNMNSLHLSTGFVTHFSPRPNELFVPRSHFAKLVPFFLEGCLRGGRVAYLVLPDSTGDRCKKRNVGARCRTEVSMHGLFAVS
jgi:hypothetical protein